MSSSLTKKGLLAASDKYIIGARPAFELIKNFTTDFTPEAVKPGTGVVVDVVKAAAENFDAATANYTHATNAATPVTVAASIRKKSTFELDDIDYIEDETAAAIAGNAVASGRAVGIELVKAVTSLLTASAAQTAGTLDDSSLAGFTALRGLAETSSTKWDGVDPSACVLLLNPTEYAKLLALLPVGVIGDGYNLSSEKIGAFIGFKAVASAPTITGTGFIVPDNAIAVVNRIIAPAKGVAGNLVEFGIATDEISGFTHTQRVVIDAAAGKVFWTTEALFGAKLTREVKSNVSNGAPGFISISLKA